jgi:hypothetical protein
MYEIAKLKKERRINLKMSLNGDIFSVETFLFVTVQGKK